MILVDVDDLAKELGWRDVDGRVNANLHLQSELAFCAGHGLPN